MYVKKCSICHVEKDIIDYNKNSTRKDGYQTHCRECSKIKFLNYYNSNKEKHKAVTAKRNKIYRVKVLQYVWDYLSTHPCVDCKQTNPLCLEFDHVRGEKFMAVSSMVNRDYSLPRVKSEIEKCEVRCANCHRIKTAKDYNWYGQINKGL